MSKKMVKFLLLMSFIVVSVGMGSKIEASEFNFSVDPKIPSNQIDKEKSYFDLLLGKGQEQDLTVDLRNDTENDVEVSTTLNSATTNINGVVEYSENGIKPDKSLKYNIKDYVDMKEKVVIPKKSTETLKIHVKSPEESFKGTMIGGITFKEIKKEEKEKDEGKGLSIKNEFSYMVALMIRQTEEKVLPNLNLVKAFPGQVNARNVINAQLQNDQPSFINQLKLKTDIKKRGKEETLYSVTKESLQVAPNSQFDFPTPLEGQPLKAGKYTMYVTALGGKHEDGKFKDENGETYRYKWDLKDDFEITADEADKLNDSDVSIEKSNMLWYVLGGVALLVLLGLLIFFVKRRNEEDEDEEETEKN